MLPAASTQPYVFKCPPMDHQLECFDRSKDLEVFAILFEQGCGKSKVIVDNAAYLYGLGRINALVIIAPNGVHKKWLEEDFPLSFPDYMAYKGAIWTGTAKSKEQCANLLKPGNFLRVLCINVEAFSHKSGFEFVKSFLRATDAMMAVDESSRIKTPTAIRTENICKLGDLAKYRRILTGTPVSNSPFDYYAQFMFLSRDIFGQSYFAFKAEYAEMVDANSPLMQAIKAKSGARFTPQIVAKSSDGKPKWKNLDKLKSIIAPYSMRVTKEEAKLNLPPKIFQKWYYPLETKQRKMYDDLCKRQKIETGGQELTVLHKMTLTLRRQQLVCGYFPTDDKQLIQLFEKPMDNPRIKLLIDGLQDIEGSVIIWCRFTEDIRQVTAAINAEYEDGAVDYYGGTSDADRSENLRLFKAGEKRFLVGNAVVGGIGLNLTIATTVIYYSNTFSYEDRKQSEDRAHRKGQTDNVVYIDMVAEDTVDTEITRALLNKEDLASYMTDFNEFK